MRLVIRDIHGQQMSLKQLKNNKKASGQHKDLDDFENLP